MHIINIIIISTTTVTLIINYRKESLLMTDSKHILDNVN